MTERADHDVCPACGGPLTRRQVEKLLRGGVHTAVMHVDADVCERCGERLYDGEVVRQFEEVREKLARQDTAAFTPLGQSFQVVEPPATPVN
jgi:YgiT-type zinc finger domain-containing protein